MFADWIAAPAVPLTRLSSGGRPRRRGSRRSSIARPMSAVFAPSDVGGARELPVGQHAARTSRRRRRPPTRAHGSRHPSRPARSARSTSRGCRATSARGRGERDRMRASAGARRQRSACRISGMCRCVPPTAYGFALPRISLASRSVFRLLPAPRRPDREHGDDVGRLDDSGRDAGREAQAHGRSRCSPGAAMRVAPDEVLALLARRRRGARARRTSTGRGSRRRRTGPSRRSTRGGGRRRSRSRGACRRSASVNCAGLRRAAARGTRCRGPASTSGVVGLQREVRERAEVRLVLDERLARVRVRGDGADLDVGMCGEEPEDLAARIAGCAGDGDRVCHGFHLRVWGRGLQTATPTAPLIRGALRRLESASGQTSARGSDARNERGGEVRSRRHGPTIASAASAPQITRVRPYSRSAAPKRSAATPTPASFAVGRLGGGERAVRRAEAQREREGLRAVGHTRAAVVVDEAQRLQERAGALDESSRDTSAAGTSSPTTSETSWVAAG